MTASPPFDFDALDLSRAADTPTEFEIKHPIEGNGLGVFVSVVGAESHTFQNYVREQANKARAKNARARNADVAKVEEEEAAIIDAIASCMTGWRTETDGKSEPVIIIGPDRLEFSHANAVTWLTRFRWVRQQVNEATADTANFIKG